jgi:fructose-bisphosphate aldolase class II
MYIEGRDLKKVFDKAKKEGYAVIASNVSDDVAIRAIIQAGHFSRTDVLLQISVGACKFASGKKQDIYEGVRILCGLSKEIAKQYDIGVGIHIDHCTPEYLDWLKFIINGKLVSSVMIDASHLSMEENIKITKEVVALAHKNGILVEAELGMIKGTEDEVKSVEAYYTKPADAVKFVKETKIDLFAPSIGNIHGVKKPENVHLKIDLLKEIHDDLVKNKLDIGLVMHGFSGMTEKQHKDCIDKGVVKFNKDTQYQIEYAKAVQQYWFQNADAVVKPANVTEADYLPDKERLDPRRWLRIAEEYIETTAITLFELSGSKNKSIFKKD